MSKQEYSLEQIQDLLSNPNVKSCTSKYITFSDDFKLKALEWDKVWIFSREIFSECVIPRIHSTLWYYDKSS